MLGLPTGLLLIFLNHYIPESPRYLASRGLLQEARRVLQRFGVDHGDGDTADLLREAAPQLQSAVWRAW